jgi:hypothetical protein
LPWPCKAVFVPFKLFFVIYILQLVKNY